MSDAHRKPLRNAAESQISTRGDGDGVERAIDLAHRLIEMATQCDNLDTVRQLLELVNARLYLKFQPQRVKMRMLNKIQGGVVLFGSAAPPIETYQGPTARQRVKGPATTEVAGPGGRGLPLPPKPLDSGWEEKLLGNVSRGDKTAIELFLTGLKQWSCSLVVMAASFGPNGGSGTS